MDKNPIFVLDCGHIISYKYLCEKEKVIRNDADKFIKGEVNDIPKIECDQCKSKIYSIKMLNKLNNIYLLVNA